MAKVLELEYFVVADVHSGQAGLDAIEEGEQC